MSDYDPFNDYEPRRPATLEEDRPRRESPGRKESGGVYNLISLVFLAATAGVILLSALLFLNPTAAYNPFPPLSPQPTVTLFHLPSTVEAMTLEAVQTNLPPTWTPSPTPTSGPSVTPMATITLTPTPFATATGVTQPPPVTNTVAVFPFTLQDEAVTYKANENDEECAWLSIAGQVFDLNGNPLPGLPVQVSGDNFEQIEFTGTAEDFGPSGYEVFLNQTPVEAEFEVRLLNTTGMPLSEPIVVRTLSSCDRNVAIVNFIQNHEFSR